MLRKMLMLKKARENCPKCGMPMAETGAPIWEVYCPNEECSQPLDNLKAATRANRQDDGPSIKSIRAAEKNVRDNIVAWLRTGNIGNAKYDEAATYFAEAIERGDYIA